MGFLDNVKSFLHSVVTDDHYALYGTPYSNSTAGGSLDPAAARLHELNSSLTHSLASSRNGSSTNVGYRPGMRLATNLHSTELQNFTNGQPPLPLVDQLWSRIVLFLEEEYPELEDNLNDGALSADLNEFEKDLAVGALPVEFRQFYKIHDGQFRGGKPTGLLMGLTLLDMESILEEYTLWAKVAERVEKQHMALQHQQHQLGNSDASSTASRTIRERLANSYLMHQKSVPANAVQAYYVHRGWVPIARDYYGNMLGLDMAPGPAGFKGQIILFGRDFDTKIVVASSFQELIFQFVSDLEAGNYTIDKSETNEDNGFLDSTRDDDYMIGDEDEDNGELAFYDRSGTEFSAARGKLSYIEVLKRRALKRYGITNPESFQTTFTPQRLARKKLPAETHAAHSTVESTADLLKETLIDDSSVPTSEVLVDATVPAEPVIPPSMPAKVEAETEELVKAESESVKAESEPVEAGSEPVEAESEPVEAEVAETEAEAESAAAEPVAAEAEEIDSVEKSVQPEEETTSTVADKPAEGKEETVEIAL